MINMIFSQPLIGLTFILAVLLSLTVHEFAHAFVAYLYGDHTAKNQGRMSFNPLVHIDPMGAVMFILVGFGWGKSVPINPLAFKRRKEGEIMSSIAGPVSNLILAIIFGIIIKLTYNIIPQDNLLAIFLQLSLWLNLALMLFNLIPVPPLDGSHILVNILPDSFYRFKVALLAYGPQVLFALIFIGIAFNVSIFGWITTVINWIYTVFSIPVLFL